MVQGQFWHVFMCFYWRSVSEFYAGSECSPVCALLSTLGGFLLYNRSARFFETGDFLQLTFAQLAEKIGGGLEVYIVLPTVRVY